MITHTKLFKDDEGRTFIEFPFSVINPLMYDIDKQNLSSAAHLTVDELSSVLQGHAVLDCNAGKVISKSAANNETELQFTAAIEWLLRKHSPQDSNKYLMSKLLMIDSQQLQEYYDRVLNRISRYNRLVEVGAPRLLTDNEAYLVQATVNDLYANCSCKEEIFKS